MTVEARIVNVTASKSREVRFCRIESVPFLDVEVTSGCGERIVHNRPQSRPSTRENYEVIHTLLNDTTENGASSMQNRIPVRAARALRFPGEMPLRFNYCARLAIPRGALGRCGLGSVAPSAQEIGRKRSIADGR